MKTKKHFQPQDLVLRCLVINRGNYWVAMCIDLDLAAQADTLPQARKLLQLQMRSYISDAFSVDSEHAPALLTRKSPLRYRLIYHWLKFCHNQRRKQSYETAMPMIPAGA